MPDENGNPLPGEIVPGTDPAPTPEPTPDPTPVDPTPTPEPAPAPKSHTIGDDLQAVEDAKAQAKTDADALAAATEKSKASDAKLADAKAHFATDLPKVGGDIFKLNPDGSATVFYASPTAADGYTSETFKPIDTVVPDDSGPSA